MTKMTKTAEEPSTRPQRTERIIIIIIGIILTITPGMYSRLLYVQASIIQGKNLVGSQ